MKSFSEWLERKPAGPKPKKRLPKVSKRRVGANREYSKKRKEYLAGNPNCFAGISQAICQKSATDIHHLCGRGPYLNVVRTWIGVCRPCHDWIHAHPSQSREMGFIVKPHATTHLLANS